MATLRQAIDIAKQEPNSERSQKLLRGIRAGKFDAIAEQEGLDISSLKIDVEGEEDMTKEEILNRRREQTRSEQLAGGDKPLSRGEKIVAGGIELGSDALVGASELGEKGIKSLGRLLTPKKFEEQFGFAKGPTAAEQLFGEDDPKTGENIIRQTREVGVGDIVSGAKEGFIEGTEKAIERIGTRKALIEELPTETRKEKALKGAAQVGNVFQSFLNTLQPVFGGVSGGIAPVAEPFVAETLESLDPKAQEDLLELTEAFKVVIQEDFGKLPPLLQELLRSAGLSVEAGTFAAGGRVAVQTSKQVGKQLIKTGAEGVELFSSGIKAADDITKSLIKKVDSMTPKIEPARATQATNILNSINKIDPNKQVQFRKLSGGDDLGTFLLKRDIVGPSDKTAFQLVERFTEAKKRLDDGLVQIKGSYKPKVVKTVLEDMREFYESTANPRALKLIEKRLAKLEKEGLTLSEINKIKREFERTIRTGYLKEKNAIKIQRNTNLDNDLRIFRDEAAIKAGFSNIKDLSKEIQLTKFAADAIVLKRVKQAANNQFSLTDNLLLVGGAINPGSLAILGFKKIGSMPGTQALLVKALKNGDMSPLKNLDIVPEKIINIKNKQKRIQAYNEWLQESGWADLMRLTDKEAQLLLPEGSSIQVPGFKPKSIADIEAVEGR